MTGRSKTGKAASALKVGRRKVPLTQAAAWVTEYTACAPGQVFSYPYYDYYDGGPPDRLTDADLLAPRLLNAAPSIRSFGELQALRHHLEGDLRRLPTDLDLVDATVHDIELAAHCYRILDDPKVWGVQGTILSKILHRKRPLLIALYDSNVSACYEEGDGAPVPPRNGRCWEEFMVELLTAIHDDLQVGLEHWNRLRMLGARGPVTPLRCLDIVAWNAGGRTVTPPEETAT